MLTIAWTELNASGHLKVKSRKFATPEAMNRFVKKLFEKEGFMEIIACN